MMKFKFEEIRRSLVNFLMAGDVQNLFDMWRILWYSPEKCESEETA